MRITAGYDYIAYHMRARDAGFIDDLIEYSKPFNTIGVAVSSSERMIWKSRKVQQLISIGEPG